MDYSPDNNPTTCGRKSDDNQFPISVMITTLSNGEPLKSPHSEESYNLDSEESTNQNADFSQEPAVLDHKPFSRNLCM